MSGGRIARRASALLVHSSAKLGATAACTVFRETLLLPATFPRAGLSAELFLLLYESTLIVHTSLFSGFHSSIPAYVGQVGRDTKQTEI